MGARSPHHSSHRELSSVITGGQYQVHLLPVFCFTCFGAHIFMCFNSFFMIYFLENETVLANRLHHSINLETAFILSPIYSILCLRFYPPYILLKISYVIGWRTTETYIFNMVSSQTEKEKYSYQFRLYFLNLFVTIFGLLH